METRNLNNPSMMSDSVGRPSIKGAFVITGINMKVSVKPYLAYLPNGTIIGRNKSTEVDSAIDHGGATTAVTVDGMERWVTIVMYLDPAGSSMAFKVIAGAQAVNTELVKPTRREHIAFTEYDIVVADIRLYFGMTVIRAEDIDLSRSETANFMDTALIPVEVYGPPLNAFKNLDEVIQGINSGALDYRYIRKDAAQFLKFNLIDVGVCGTVQTPKGDGYLYYVDDGTDKFLALNMGCAACQLACEACNVGGETGCLASTECPTGQACHLACEPVCDTTEVHPPYFSYNEGVKRVVLTDPPVGFCPLACDVTCETSTDTIPCPSCETCEAYCEDYCQTGCMIVCDVGDVAAACGDACQATCEISCEATCMTYCQVGCEVTCQTLAEYPCGNQCEITCQSGYQINP